jgi:rubredoxin
MKIVIQGMMLKVERPWWVGRRMLCLVCGAVFDLEEGDKVTASRMPVDRGAVRARLTALASCPCCGVVAELNVDETVPESVI